MTSRRSPRDDRVGVAASPRRLIARRRRSRRRAWAAGAARAERDRDGPLQAESRGRHRRLGGGHAGGVRGRRGRPAHAQRRSVASGRAAARAGGGGRQAARRAGQLAAGLGQQADQPGDRARARAGAPVDVQYQSNGGAIVRVEIRFGDWLEAPTPSSARTASRSPCRAFTWARRRRPGSASATCGSGAAVYRITAARGQERRRCQGRQGRAPRAVR
jgi:hypothetical protein